MSTRNLLLLRTLAFLACVVFSVSGDDDSDITCTAYCDLDGFYQPGFACDPSIYGYCCGDETFRECCNDEEHDVGHIPAVSSCPRSSWWYYQWRVVVGLLVTLIGLLVVAACCYYCCGDPQSPRRLWRRNRSSRQEGQDTEITTVTGNVGENADTQLSEPPGPTFDPESPYAFMPPDYESLPKDPPKYCDIYENEAFENDAEVSASASHDNAMSGQASASGGNASSDTYTTIEDPRLQTITPNSPPPAYEADVMPTVSVDDHQGPPLAAAAAAATGASAVENTDSEAGSRNDSRSSPSGSVIHITVASGSNSDVDSDVEPESSRSHSTSRSVPVVHVPRGEPRLEASPEMDNVSNPLYTRDTPN